MKPLSTSLFVLLVLSACGPSGTYRSGGGDGGGGNGGDGGGGNGGDGGSGPVSITFDEYASMSRADYCVRAARCGVYQSVENCLSAVRYYDWAAEKDALAAGHLRFDGVLAAACLDRWLNEACDAEPDWPADCEPITAGLLKDGDTCVSTVECGLDSYCPPATAPTCSRQCAPRQGDGGMVNTSDGCKRGFYLSYVSGAFICRAWIGPGGDCTPSMNNLAQCQPGYYCDPGHRCQPRERDGSACSADGYSECRRYCVDGKCGAPAKLGAVCGDSPFIYCQSDAFCRQPNGSNRGTCIARIADGAPCDVSDVCLHGLCITASNGATSGTCGPQHGPGMSCFRGGECDSKSYCSNMVCVAYGGTGASCSSGGQCISQKCVNNACAAPDCP